MRTRELTDGNVGVYLVTDDDSPVDPAPDEEAAAAKRRQLAEARQLDSHMLTQHEKMIRARLLHAGFTPEQVSEAYVAWAALFDKVAERIADRIATVAYDLGYEEGWAEEYGRREHLGATVLSRAINRWREQNPDTRRSRWPAGLRYLFSRIEGTPANVAGKITPVRSLDDLIAFLESYFTESYSEPRPTVVARVPD